MKQFLFLASFLGATSSAFAYTWTLHDPFFLTKDAFDLNTAIAPPPAHGSAAEKGDFKRLMRYQKSRTPEQCERAAKEVEVSLENLFGPKYGPLTQAEVKKWEGFFDKIRNDTDWFVGPLKKKWDRPRPYFVDEKLSPCVKREVTKAYPSGHAAISRVFADVLETIYPERKGAFRGRADQIAEDRVISGVHHPADIAAGKQFGDALYKKLSESPLFKAQLQELR